MDRWAAHCGRVRAAGRAARGSDRGPQEWHRNGAGRRPRWRTHFGGPQTLALLPQARPASAAAAASFSSSSDPHCRASAASMTMCATWPCLAAVASASPSTCESGERRQGTEQGGFTTFEFQLDVPGLAQQITRGILLGGQGSSHSSPVIFTHIWRHAAGQAGGPGGGEKDRQTVRCVLALGRGVQSGDELLQRRGRRAR